MGLARTPHQKSFLSMFQRRVLLLVATGSLVFIAYVAQAIRLTVIHGDENRARAEASLDRVRYLPTFRGRILDRNDRVLAEDRPGYDLAVRFEVITGSWVVEQSRREAQRQLGRARWLEMSENERLAAAREHEATFTDKTRQLWQLVRERGKNVGGGPLDALALHERLDAIKREVQSLAAVVWSNQRQAAERQFGAGPSGSYQFTARPIREQELPHVILAGISEEDAFIFRRFGDQMPGMIVVQDAHQRIYPWLAADVHIDRSTFPKFMRSDTPITVRINGIADHILGSVREGARAEDIARRPFRETPTRGEHEQGDDTAHGNHEGGGDLGGYRSLGDRVGILGIERSMEDTLRGHRGRIVERRDTGVVQRLEPQPGRDVRLSIDILLQARVQALLSEQAGLTRVQHWHRNDTLPEGTSLNAAAVILEVDTGEILAMVSMPTVAMGRERMEQSIASAEGVKGGGDRGDAWASVNQPWIHRAIEAVYPPGSIIKPLVLCAAVKEREHSLYEPILCTGWFFEHAPNTARCWIYREQYNMQTHGALAADEAMARSCNIFFETLADRLGMQRLMDWFGRFGLGRPLDVGLLAERLETGVDGTLTMRSVGEAGGRVLASADIESLRRQGDFRYRTIISGIGQGEVLWTPVQAANAYAQLARAETGGGRDATILLSPAPNRGPRQRFELPRELVAITLEGLRQSVMESFGTGNHITHEDLSREAIINAQGVKVWAKTGTAQAPPWYCRDTNADGRIDTSDEPVRGVDHAWFVGLVGPAGASVPLYSIAVIVEYGGSGGRISGPLANQIIHALQAEGYLPGK